MAQADKGSESISERPLFTDIGGEQAEDFLNRLNYKALVDSMVSSMLAQTLQDLRDYAQERRQRESEFEQRIRQQEEAFQARMSLKATESEQRIRHAEEEYSSRRKQAEAMGSHMVHDQEAAGLHQHPSKHHQED